MPIKMLQILALALVLLTGLPGPSPAGTRTGEEASQKIAAAIKIQQNSQKDQDLWEEEKAALVAEYTRLTQVSQALEQQNKALTAQVADQKALNETLAREKAESQRLLEEVPGFTESVFSRLTAMVDRSIPFLSAERTARLAKLEKDMHDPSVTSAVRYRRVMETLFIEAEYGGTCEVSREKILMDPSDTELRLATVFRLGRVALFYLSLDRTACGMFDPAENHWRRLPGNMIPSIRAAVEMEQKQRTAELVSLPIGRIAKAGGVQ